MTVLEKVLYSGESAWPCKGQYDIVSCPGIEPAGHGPSRVLAVAGYEACLYK